MAITINLRDSNLSFAGQRYNESNSRIFVMGVGNLNNFDIVTYYPGICIRGFHSGEATFEYVDALTNWSIRAPREWNTVHWQHTARAIQNAINLSHVQHLGSTLKMLISENYGSIIKAKHPESVLKMDPAICNFKLKLIDTTIRWPGNFRWFRSKIDIISSVLHASASILE